MELTEAVQVLLEVENGAILRIHPNSLCGRVSPRKARFNVPRNLKYMADIE